jgi:hypothetical protein
MTDPSLPQLTYDLAQGTIGEQESQVRDVRSRMAPLLAGATAAAGLLAKPALARHHDEFRHRDAHVLAVSVGALGVLVVILSAAYVLRSRRLAFTADAIKFYGEAYKDRASPGVYLLRLAATLRARAAVNEKTIRRLHRAFNLALVGLGLEILGFVVAVALA